MIASLNPPSFHLEIRFEGNQSINQSKQLPGIFASTRRQFLTCRCDTVWTTWTRPPIVRRLTIIMLKEV